MIPLNAPLDDMLFLMHDVLQAPEPELHRAILTEAAKFSDQELLPLNSTGDQQGAKIKGSDVNMPPGFKDAYQKFVQNGWNSIAHSTELGGQGMSHMLTAGVFELFNSANMAFMLCPLLTQSAAHLLADHGNKQQQEAYLNALVSGEMTGTMCLTEPQAGSDLGAIQTKAIKKDNEYYLEGQKIFITYGDHDMVENIVHLVLARTPDAPAGSKGISLFLVPKILPDGTKNDVKAISLEHKMGIHASPTAVMAFGENNNCKAMLIGQENKGLPYMFTMMNHARLAVGIEGLGIAERSLQLATHYAHERKQGGHVIAEYPDIQRTLDTMQANIEAIRGLIYFTAHKMDDTADENSKKIVALLIPVVKAYATDIGFEAASQALQIFGGMGYIEETGVAQLVRDARIAMIYEGTNGIQAKDLVERKLIKDDSAEAMFAYIKKHIKAHPNTSLATALTCWQEATEYMRTLVTSDRAKAQYRAYPYLQLTALVLGGYIMSLCQAALPATQQGYHQRKARTVKHYLQHMLLAVEYKKNIIMLDT